MGTVLHGNCGFNGRFRRFVVDRWRLATTDNRCTLGRPGRAAAGQREDLYTGAACSVELSGLITWNVPGIDVGGRVFAVGEGDAVLIAERR